jgi:hypothetical protein
MADDFVAPKGRTTVRKSGGRRVRLWTIPESDNPLIAGLERAYLGALEAVDRTEAKHATIKGDPRFTEQGVRDELQRHALSDAIPQLYRGRLAINKARSAAAERRAKFKLDAPDKTDYCAGLRRLELRSYLHDMKPEDRSRFVERSDLPLEVFQAITEQIPELSGVSPGQHAMMIERALQAQFGPEIEAVNHLEQAIDTAASAVEAAREEVRIELGIFDPGLFNSIAAPVEEKQSVAWLRKSKGIAGAEEVVVVDLERRVSRKATEDEIATGIFADSIEEFEAKRAA